MPAQVMEVTDAPTGLKKYVWRTDLLAHKPYWQSWFENLTSIFLTMKVKRILLLGSDSLDQHLLEGLEAGKFSMK